MTFKNITISNIESFITEIQKMINQEGLVFSLHISTLRGILNCKNKYSFVSDFKTHKLFPLCDFFGITVDDDEKLGRKVISLKFKVDEKLFKQAVCNIHIQNKDTY